MKKILFATPYYTPNIVGGAEISTQLVAERFPNNIIILTVDKKEDSEVVNGVRVVKVADRNLSPLWEKVLENKTLSTKEKIMSNYRTNFPNKTLVQKYKDIIHNYNIEAVICNSNADSFSRASLWQAVYESDVPLIIALRDPILLEKKIFGIDVSDLYIKNIIKQLRKVSCFVAPSQYMIDLHCEKGVVAPRCVVIPNAVDVSFKTPKFEQKDLEIIYAGNLMRKKGIFTLIKAVEELRKKYPALKLKLIGRGELQEHCQNIDFIEMVPWMTRENLYNAFRKCWLVVLPSEWPEAFGRIIVESVAQGTIAIGSDAGGIPEIFGNYSQYIFKSGDFADLKDKIERVLLLSEEEYVSEVLILQNAFQRFDITSYKNNWKKFLDSI